MIAVGLGVLLLLALTSFYLFSLRSFVAMSNYGTLNNQNRNTSDILSRDIRSAKGVTSITTNQLVLKYGAGPSAGNITYTYDPASRLVTRTTASGTRTLLAGVTAFAVSAYKRPDTNAYNQFSSTTNPSAKIVSFQWTCSRRVVGAETTSETLQTANVVLRNK